MLASSAVARTSALLGLYRPTLSRLRKASTSSISDYSDAPSRPGTPTMFKRAVDNHAATAAKPHSHFLPGQPLAAASPNMMAPSISTYPEDDNLTLSAGVKRSSSGLAKALSGRNAFDELPPPPQSAAQSNSMQSSSKTIFVAPGVYFDEDDFDSDVELDIEDPSSKGTVTHPELPRVPSPSLPSTLKSFTPQQAPSTGTTLKSALIEQQTLSTGSTISANDTAVNHNMQALASSQNELPWSSSPPDHLRTPASKRVDLRQFSYQNPNVPTTAPLPAIKEDVERPAKRRALPWSDGSSDDDTYEKRESNKSLPWNTTASALKEQQKQLRQSKKKTKDSSVMVEAMKGSKKRPYKVHLSDEQQHVLDLIVESGKSVFFTGSAGTGKSVLLREVIAALRKKNARETERVAVTASTGLAACNIGGVTLHSFAGIGLGKEEVPELVKKVKKNQKAKHRWLRTKTLVIDEISMVDADLFDKLEEIARRLRNNGRPFGGIQLVITGDFFQLPPVPENGRMAKFAFQAGTWNTTIEHTIGLHHIFRQKDPEFAGMLNEMREGHLSSRSIARFRSLNRNLARDDDIEATELFPTRAEVEQANNARMRNLPGQTEEFAARDGGTIMDKSHRDRLLSSCIAPEVLHLKKGSQVMLIKNMDETLVNGSLGKVIGFMSEATFDSYQLREADFFEAQADGPGSLGGPPKKPKKESLTAGSASNFPVVRFVLADGSTRDLLCQREQWTVELPNGEVQASRQQVPLILAWALSIHKAQGQTLERVKVDLGRVFEKGQAYVALSRATSMAGLQVLRFDPSKVMAHDAVRGFYASLSRAEAAAGPSEEGGKSVIAMLRKGGGGAGARAEM